MQHSHTCRPWSPVNDCVFTFQITCLFKVIFSSSGGKTASLPCGHKRENYLDLWNNFQRRAWCMPSASTSQIVESDTEYMGVKQQYSKLPTSCFWRNRWTNAQIHEESSGGHQLLAFLCCFSSEAMPVVAFSLIATETQPPCHFRNISSHLCTITILTDDNKWTMGLPDEREWFICKTKIISYCWQ